MIVCIAGNGKEQNNDMDEIYGAIKGFIDNSIRLIQKSIVQPTQFSDS